MSRLKKKLQTLDKQSLYGFKIGLEKESLRINQSEKISGKRHPKALGSPLTHPYITTDYAEALLELITPPCNSSAATLDFLSATETYVYHHLNKEFLWNTSMPCSLNNDDDIIIAQYGESNIGKMKTIYRRGLGHRYGKMMQVIAGVHFNFSFPQQLWLDLLHQSQSNLSVQNYINQSYMDMTRNIQRYGWLVIYLFGASPAISKTFVKGLPNSLQKLDKDSFYEPYATSLRMGDIGYTNSREGKSGIHIGYNSLEEYISSMRNATSQQCLKYEKIGVKKQGTYQQLNANILQIENEHYSTVRPKQVLHDLEKPIHALQTRGIEYIELRSLDINPYSPTGLTLHQLHFLEVFMCFCLFKNSPLTTAMETQEINYNQCRVAHQGRKPGLKIQHFGDPILLQEYAGNLFNDLQQVAEKLDQTYACSRYSDAVQAHQKMISNPALTPSARILAEMHEHRESFIEFSLRKSYQQRDHYLKKQMDIRHFEKFEQLSQTSLQQQKTLEKKDISDFEQFLKQYQAGKKKPCKHSIKQQEHNTMLV